jgi:hypothetical protein
MSGTRFSLATRSLSKGRTGGSIPDKLGEKMAPPLPLHVIAGDKARFFARSDWNPSALPPMRGQSVARAHRFPIHNVKQRTRLR